jgi:hypothetical protein
MTIRTSGTTLTFNDATTQTTAPVNTNANVNSVSAGTGISVSATTGALTVTNTGLVAGGTIATGTVTTLTTTTLNSTSGVLATQNGMTGIAKAWINYNGATQTINGSFNVSSVTYSSAGVYLINFTTAFANTNYCPVTNSLRDTTNPLYYNAHAYNLSTTQCRIYNGFADSYSGAIPDDSVQVNLAVFSS